MRRVAGFTVAELITVAAIIAVLAAIALPVTRFVLRREREVELRECLHRVTDAIDRYHELRARGVVKAPPDLAAGTYPKTLEELTKPVELIDGKRLVFLRKRDLIDPMTGEDWKTSSSTDERDATNTNGDNVFDIHSPSAALALSGRSYYKEW